MKGIDCSQDCNQNTCPFVNDPRRPSRYVCLKCGLERWLEEPYNPFFFLLLVAAIAGVIVLLSGCTGSTGSRDNTSNPFNAVEVPRGWSDRPIPRED